VPFRRERLDAQALDEPSEHLPHELLEPGRASRL